jgi:hypothetical protein
VGPDPLPFAWADIQRRFPKEEVARLRMRLLEEHRNGARPADLCARYRISRPALYDTLRRYEHARSLEEFMDRPRAPRNPFRKVAPEHEALIVQLAREDRDFLSESTGGSWPN